MAQKEKERCTLNKKENKSKTFQPFFIFFSKFIKGLYQLSVQMNCSRRIDSTPPERDFGAFSLRKDSNIQGTTKNQQKGNRKNDELNEMISFFKQFISFTKTQTARCREQSQFEDPRQLQPRDRIVLIPLPSEELTKDELQNFLSKLCKIVWSRAFHYYSTQQLSYEYTKIYSTQEILRNIVRLSQRFQLTSQHFEIINTHLQQKLLEYKMAKYPMTQSQEVNRNVNNAIRETDNTDQPMNDYLFNSSVRFKFRESGEYNDLIMTLINEIIKKIEQKVGTKSAYQKFQEKMERLFESVLDEDLMKEVDQDRQIIDQCESKDNLDLIHHKHSISEEQFKKELIKIKQKQKEKYRSKVQEYTSFKIGKKLPDSTRLFTQQEISSHNLKIQSPQILRILTKWCDQLQTKFTTQNYFEHYIESLKLENGKFMVLVLNQVKEGLDQLMAQEHRNIKAELAELVKNNYFMQSELLFHEIRHAKVNEIERYESIAAKYSIDIVNNLHSYTLAYLNRLIHGLLTVAIKFTKLPIVSQFQWPSSLSLITFQINDLVRCRCASGEREIIKLYNELLRLCEADRMRMVKVSNRLRRGTHDVVLTVKYREVLCEIQLSVTNKIHKFAEYSNAFNHYLYELKRSVFGPLTQLCNIWKSTDGRFTVYKNLRNEKPPTLFAKLQHDCDNRNQYETYSKPFICSSCDRHYYHNNYIKHHLKCKYCTFWVCARCQLEVSDCKSMLAAAYKEDEIIIRSNRLKRKGNSNIPDYGICIFIQSQSIKVQPFRKHHAKGKTSIIGVKNKKLYCISDVTTEEEKRAFKEEFLVFEVGEAYGKRHIKIDDERIADFFLCERLNSIYERNKEKICLNYGGISNEQFVVLCKLGTPAQRENIKRLEIIGNRLQSVAPLANSFKNIRQLQIGKNNVSSFEDLEKLEKLEVLCVNENKVKQFPTEVCHLWNLKELTFCDNQIKTLPDDINKLHKLKVLKISNNQIEKLPRCISQLCYLNELHLKTNKIKEVPDFIGLLNELQILQLECNSISFVHSDISKLSNLQQINLSCNQLSEFPRSLTIIKSLQRCSLKDNKINTVPTQINQLQNLTYLNLSKNKITNFPAVDSLVDLQQLNLSENSLQELQQFQCEQKKLKFLSVSHNKLRLLPSFHNLGLLQQLHLNNNHIETVPQSLGRLQRLETLRLQFNEISRLCELKLEALRSLSLSQNKIPSFCSMDLICVEEIDLSSNCLAVFAGNLMPCLKRADLSGNALETLDVSNYPKLKYLRAGMNKLQHFPKVEEKNHIKTLSLQHNLIRALPMTIAHFHNVAQLNLAYNQLTDAPKQIQFLSSLKEHSLDLSHNPIDRVEVPQFIIHKCTQATLQELQPMLRTAPPVKIPQEQPSPKQAPSQQVLHTQSNKTIEKI